MGFFFAVFYWGFFKSPICKKADFLTDTLGLLVALATILKRQYVTGWELDLKKNINLLRNWTFHTLIWKCAKTQLDGNLPNVYWVHLEINKPESEFYILKVKWIKQISLPPEWHELIMEVCEASPWMSWIWKSAGFLNFNQLVVSDGFKATPRGSLSGSETLKNPVHKRWGGQDLSRSEALRFPDTVFGGFLTPAPLCSVKAAH